MDSVEEILYRGYFLNATPLSNLLCMQSMQLMLPPGRGSVSIWRAVTAPLVFRGPRISDSCAQDVIGI